MPLSKRSRRGTFWTLIIGCLIAVAPRLLIISLGSDDKIEVSHTLLVEMADEMNQDELERQEAENNTRRKKYKTPAEQFDPNKYTVADWMNLGLSQKQADVIVRFTERGIRSNEDLKRIFVLPEELFLLIKDSTYYPERKFIPTSYEKKEERVWLDINQASAEELEKLPGIGPYIAGRIVDYRTRLGGFIDGAQLMEIKKIDDQKMADIAPHIYFGESEMVRININTADYQTLKAHPYISYEVANSIVKMRAQVAFQSVEDIKRSKLIDEALFTKLKPYLTVK